MTTGPDHNDEKSLAFDIAYALSRSPLRPKGHLTVDACRATALALIAHLKLSRWRFTRLSPEEAHSAGGRPGEGTSKDA